MNGGIFNNGVQMPVQLQKINEPVNWQHYRIQAAIDAMQTVDDHVSTVEELAKRCVRYADALIAELKKGGQNENN